MNKSNIIRILSVIILSSLVTYFLCHLPFLRTSDEPIVVSFTASGNYDSPFVLYYTENDAESFSEERKAFSENNLKPESTKFDISIPCDHITRVRVDFFERPGEVIISNIRIKGDKNILFTYNDVKITNDLTFEQIPDGIKIISDKIDPYIVISELDLNRPVPIGLMAVIIWILTFVLLWILLKRMSREMDSENAFFVLCFVLILFTPRFFVSKETVSLEEKRALTEKPVINTKEDIKGYGKKYEEWFNDHFFQRKDFQNLHDGILEVFRGKQGRLYNDAIVGEEQWMFLRKDDGFVNYANSKLFSEAELDNIAKYIQKLDSWCNERGKKFYFFVAPDKDKIYGEYYKYVIKTNPDSLSRSQQLIKYIQKNTNVKCLSAYNRLMKEKGKELLYYKQDTHWSDMGGYYGADELLALMSSDMEINRCKFVSLDSMLWQNGDMRGMCPGYKVVDETFYKMPVMNEERSVMSEGSTHYVCPSRQRKIMVYGDSFGYMLAKYLSYSFGEVKLNPIARVGNEHYTIVKEDIDALDSDVVVLEVVERFLPFLYGH